MLHCIEQSVGENSGVNFFIDGFHVLEQFKENNKQGFDILTDVKFRNADKGSDIYGKYHTACERPLIG